MILILNLDKNLNEYIERKKSGISNIYFQHFFLLTLINYA